MQDWEEEGELADFEDYLNGQLLAGALDDFMTDAMPQRRAPVAPPGVTTHTIKAYVQWNHEPDPGNHRLSISFLGLGLLFGCLTAETGVLDFRSAAPRRSPPHVHQ